MDGIIPRRCVASPLLFLLSSLCVLCVLCGESWGLEAGFAETDITPKLGDKPVYMAGFGHDRKATGVHDPLMARAVVLSDGDDKIALVSADLVGLFRPFVQSVRKQLPGFRYVLVSSTHNHEGPDTLGLWGPSAFKSGVDKAYLDFVAKQIVKAVKVADADRRAVKARVGKTNAPELLHDNRKPIVKHDELVVLEFHNEKDRAPAGLIVQWNCHPETLGSNNTLLTADYVGSVVEHLTKRRRCPVVYLTGTVGGLMTSLKVDVRGEDGKPLADGTFDKADRYGVLLGNAAERALARAVKVELAPIAVHSRRLFLPMDNQLYRLGRQLGVFDREAFVWAGDPDKAEPARKIAGPLCVETELAWLRLGEVDIATIPGEIYPELVLGKVEDPAVEGADFPDAPVEPSIYGQLKGPHRMIIGLANDELGYIIPKRQWDDKPPYCYGLKKSQYGEVNSLGPDTAPLLCAAFRELVKGKK